jgi:hypothetical protein
LLALIESTNPAATPAYLLSQLKQMRFLVETDAQVGTWELAVPFARWVEHLHQLAKPVSSQRIQGRLSALEHRLAAFRAAEGTAALAEGRDILREVRDELHGLSEDLRQTRAAIAATVSEEKSTHRKQSASERFRRINRLWTEYLLPMLDLLNPTGPLETLCLAWERQLAAAVEKKFLPERRVSERISREMQRLRVAVRQSFRECRNEIEPLHARLRRDTQWAEGAARILARVEREGVANGTFAACLPNSAFRFNGQISRAALEASAASWRETTEPPPAINFSPSEPLLEAQAIENILADVARRENVILPMQDLLKWLAEEHAKQGFHAVHQSFSHLVTDARYQARFASPVSEYEVAGGLVRCGRVQLEIPVHP